MNTTGLPPQDKSLNPGVNLQTSLAPAPLEASQYIASSSSLAFIDASVSQIDTLIAGMAPDTEVHILKSGKDAITQITETLLNRQGISSLNIISHGSAGSLDFASNSLNAYNIRSYTEQLQSWGNALTENADILLYGCNVAENALGKSFVEIIRQVTGADVAASNDLTGNAAKGGNWELEYKAGEIETSQLSLKNIYKEILATYTVSNTADSGAGSLRDAINQANNNPGADNIVFGSVFSDPSADIIALNSQLIINDSVTVQGTGQNLLTIRGMNSRVFFINQGIVNISGMTLTGRAQGGDGGPGAGGGLGAGGAIFINGVTSTGIVPTQVNISNVLFSNNQAIGGIGGYISGNQATGGGGGLNSNGGIDSAGGGGFGGIGGSRDSGGNGGAGGSGGFFGNTGGIGGTGTVTIGTTAGNGSNGGFGGGGGGGGFGGNAPEGSGGNGGDFGGGGGSGGNSANIYVGNDRAAAGNGGFGGGGGASLGGKGGNGGFGAGGGRGSINGNGGTFGGNASNAGGGGGAGLGGAIFVRSGSLNLTNATFNNNTATGGMGGAPGTQGLGKAGAIFVNSDATLNASGTTFSGNSATSTANTPFDNRDTYLLSEVSISGSNNAATESPNTESTFRISRKGSSNSQVVNFTVSGNATRNTDYTLTVNGNIITGNSVFIPTGQSFVDIAVRPISDNVREGTENISINLLPGLDYLVTNANATVSIVDQPTVNITTTDVNAVDSTGSTGAFRISRTDNIGELTVSFTSSGSASRGTDYNFTVAGATVDSNNIVIPDGQNFIDVLITPVNDTQTEGIENVILNLTSVSNTKYVVGSANATVNITDVPIVSIRAEDADAVELVMNTNTSNTGTFRISRTDTIGDLTVNFGRSGNATISNDYNLLVGGQPITGNSVIIQNGRSFVDVVVTPARDGQFESIESVILNLISDSTYFIGDEFATVNITDTPGIRITALDASAVESTRGTATFRVSRTDSTGNAMIRLNNRGSASVGSDYTLSVNGNNLITSSVIDLNMLDGQSFVDIVVAPTSDTQQEGTETIILDLALQSGYQVIGNSSATVDITEVPVVSITAIDAWAVDSPANVGNTGTFRISRNDNIGNLWVDFARSDNFNTSLGTDYTFVVDGRNITGDSVLILDGQSFVDVVVVPRADNINESRETVTLNLLPDTSYLVDNADATVNITDLPVVRVTTIDDSAVEATGGTGVFRIERTDSTGIVTVNFSLGGAASNNDYNASIGGKPLTGNSITFLQGQSFVDVVITPVFDGQREAMESVTLNLTNLSNTSHVIGNTSATVNITDIPVVNITAIDSEALDSLIPIENTGTFRISRNDTVGDLKVNLKISGTAIAPEYVLLVNGRPITSDNSVTIANGQSFIDVVLSPMRDAAVEGTEDVTLNILSNSAYSISNANATVNILDNPAFTIMALDDSAVESSRGTGTFRISRTDNRGNATVYFDRSGSASLSSDYNLSAFGRNINGSSIEIFNGESYVDVFVSPVSDNQQEATETVTLELYAPTNGYAINNASATVNITDTPVVSITALDADAVDTTGNTGAFRISRNDTVGNMTVNFDRPSGGATYFSDYTLVVDGREVTNSVTIQAGESFADVIVVPKLDGQGELRETVRLNLSNSMNNAYSIDNASAIVYISDSSRVRIMALDASAVEETRGTATFRIFRTDSTGDITLDIKLSGAATLGNDYTLSVDDVPFSGNKIVMLNGQSFVDVVVTPTPGGSGEFTENVKLDLVSISSSTTSHIIGIGSATVNITDLPLVDITAIDADAVDSTMSAGNTGTFRISRNDTIGNLRVNIGRSGNVTSTDYTLVVNGRAINTTDNSIIIPNGKSFVDVTVEPTRDSLTEGTENITLNLINPGNYLVGNASATVNITDAPVLRITALDGDAVETPLSTGAFRISRTENTGNISVMLDINGSATFRSDYRLIANGKEMTSSALDMLNGQSYVDVVVVPISDTEQEFTETVTLDLIPPSNYLLENNSSATVNITERTTVSITAIDTDAIDSTVNTGRFRISRNDTLGDLRVSFGRSGNANSTNDYTLFNADLPYQVNNEVTISDGESFVDVLVVPTQDSIAEPSEAVILSLSQSMGGYLIGNASATVNITDLPVVRIEALDDSAVEATRSTATFRISRTSNIGEVTANFAFRGTAVGNDYTFTVDGRPVTGGITMLNGQSFVDVVVTPTLDSQLENIETLTLDITNLFSSTGNSHTIGAASATVNITDIPVVNITAIDASAIDSIDNTGTFRISRNDTVGDLKVNFARSGNATVDTDYTLLVNGRNTTADSVTISNGQSYVDVVVAPRLDGQTEGTENVTLNLIPDSSYLTSNINATVSITDRPVVNITALDASAVESTLKPGIFRIERTDSIGSITVNFANSGNAMFGNDYTLNVNGQNINGSSITMLSGQSFVDVVVAPRQDGQTENTEAVTLNLTSISSNNNYVLGNTNATVNITDLPTVNITAIDPDATELAGNTGIFRISRNDNSGELRVNLLRSGSASAGSDYILTSDSRMIPGDSITFLNGQSFVDVVVTPNLDSTQEGNEVVTLSVAPNNFGISSTNSIAAVTIIDAPIITIAAIDADAAETPGNTGAFRISRNGTSGNLTVNFTRSGQATSGIDYTLSVAGTVITGNSVVIADGQSSVDVLLAPIDDSQAEAAETAQFQVSTGSYAISTTNRTAIVTIAASDNLPTVNNISKSGNEDTVISFNSSDFTAQFTDIDGDSLSKIKITSFPTNGVLKLGGANVTLNQEITIADIANLTFTPDANFDGAVSFTWNGFDGSTYAATDAAVNLTINPTPEWEIVAVEDFTGDGRQDILQRDSETGNVRVWYLNANNIGETLTMPTMEANWKIARTADFNKDGKVDVFWRNTNTGENRVWLMNNTSIPNVQNVMTLSTAWRPEVEAIADFDGDGNLDIFWRNYEAGSGWNAIWKMSGTQFKDFIALPTVADVNTKIAAVIDFDGDGKNDILWRNSTTGENAIWKMNGINYGSFVSLPGVVGAKIEFVGNLDADASLEILWRNSTTGENAIWNMNGANYGDFLSLPGVLSSTTSIKAVADFDGDGKLDIFWHDRATGWNSIWKMDGTFYAENIALKTQPNLSFEIKAINDFDGDGDVDIVWYDSTTSATSVWRLQATMFDSELSLF